eukprot:1926402-Heterocapsa_arctica.AAC.1
MSPPVRSGKEREKGEERKGRRLEASGNRKDCREGKGPLVETMTPTLREGEEGRNRVCARKCNCPPRTNDRGHAVNQGRGIGVTRGGRA